MTDKELKKLSRMELLEILIDLSNENIELKNSVQELSYQLDNRNIMIGEVGSIAEASLKLNGVFEAAEAAASQYIENIKRISESQEEISKQVEAKAQQKAEEMLNQAEEQCSSRIEETDNYCKNKIEETDSYCKSKLEETELCCKNKLEETDLICKEKLDKTKDECDEMLRQANDSCLKSKQEAELYWNNVSEKIFELCREHEFLRNLLNSQTKNNSQENSGTQN